MAEETIPYEKLVQEALRQVVKVALERAAGPEGMPGSHHFYITFKTSAPGVTMPGYLLEKYPDEMTIVLKTRFWDLEVEPEEFSVRLTFNDVPARLTIPFAAIARFYDPTVSFGLQFEVDVPPRVEPDASAADPESEADAPAAEPAPDGGGEVVSLDAFRSKK